MKKVLALLAVFLLTTSNLYAGNGDLIVNGNVGVGTTAPENRPANHCFECFPTSV